MNISQRDFSGEADKREMEALVYSFPDANLHVVDLPYRLSSWALDYRDNVGLWAGADGQLLAWAVMQTPFWTIDYALHPEADEGLLRRILAWADGRARTIVHSASGHPMWFVNVLSGQTERIHELEAAGFADQADVGEDSWSKVLMRRPAHLPVAEFSLPAGFSIRPLAGGAEVEAYVELHRAAFGSKNMTVEWRERVLSSPRYTPDLDLVAVAPDGRLAAFCVGWINLAAGDRSGGQIEPMGVHEEWHRLGLGRAILLECIRRLQGLGAERLYVETDNWRDAAFALYESVGFQVMENVLVYRKAYGDNEEGV